MLQEQLFLIGPRIDLTFTDKIFLTTYYQYNNLALLSIRGSGLSNSTDDWKDITDILLLNEKPDGEGLLQTPQLQRQPGVSVPDAPTPT